MELEQLKKKIEELEKWKADHERQQLRFPLDAVTKRIVQDRLVVANGKTVDPVGLLTDTTALQVLVNGNTYWILAAPTP